MVERPNLLLVIFDQLRYDVVEDTELCATPTFDRLRRQGAWFEHHYTSAGICSPARASLMTGLYPHNHGVLNNVHGRAAVVGELPRDHPTLGELLTDAGYRTGYVGKWHLGRSGSAHERGWADVRFPEGEDDPRLQIGLRDHLGSMVYTRPRREAASPYALYLRDPVPPSLVPANVAAEGALNLLSAYASDRHRFCLAVSFAEPHHPTILSEAYVDRYDPAEISPWPSFTDTFEGKPHTNGANLRRLGVADFTWEDWAPVVARYLATVTMLDELLGQLIGELERLHLAGNTVVIVTADHGDMLGSHRLFNKGSVMYDDVYRIPLCIWGPPLTDVVPGRRISALTSHVDLLPTITELTRVTAPARPLDGRSLVPALRGATASGGRESVLCEFHGDEFGLYSQRMLRRGHHKLVYNPNDIDELYDLESDPDELCNLSAVGSATDTRVEMERTLLETMRLTADPLAEFAGMTLG